jgi:hypothetical protein
VVGVRDDVWCTAGAWDGGSRALKVDAYYVIHYSNEFLAIQFGDVELMVVD